MWKWALAIGAGGLLAAAWLAYAVSWGLFGKHEGPGTITGDRVPAPVIDVRVAGVHRAATDLGAATDRQILFGDLHAHTTFSTDAFAASLPILGGHGSNPPANACDFARYCSALDFWSINDHASNLSPRHWRETRESIRECNARAGDPLDPDVVAFLGWEWTQVGQLPENHFGHKNVILLETDDAKVPARPISEPVALAVGGSLGPGMLALLDDEGPAGRYVDFARYMKERDAVPLCADDVDTKELRGDCRELAATPAELYRKLREWGGEAIVIPHGTSWGFYTPPGSTWDKQVSPEQNDPGLQTLFEVYSGHGNSEEYRDWRAVRFDDDGTPRCPEPTSDYLPSCWRAGELIAMRCRAAGLDEGTCDERERATRQFFVDFGSRGFQIVPGQEPQDWLDAGQCRDCFLPAFNFRPGGSAQYATAVGWFASDGSARHARFGFVAASDGHRAKPGIGYKQIKRDFFVDGLKTQSPRALEIVLGRGGDRDLAEPIAPKEFGGFGTLEIERTAAFMTAGGLSAVHSDGRDRGSIWAALKRRESYGTSGTKILLWFDLVNAPADADGVRPDGSLPMGSEAFLDRTPRFRVRAAGSFEQHPGCPEHSKAALGSERLAALCANECDHPSDTRRRITRVEVVRIRPQIEAGEPIGELVEDPWLTLPCPQDRAGCVVEFEDPEFVASGRSTAYYVRAIEEQSLVINADGLRCTYDESGRCVSVNGCWQDFRTAVDDDCLSPAEERAWSSPIWIDPGTPDPTRGSAAYAGTMETP